MRDSGTCYYNHNASEMRNEMRGSVLSHDFGDSHACSSSRSNLSVLTTKLQRAKVFKKINSRGTIDGNHNIKPVYDWMQLELNQLSNGKCFWSFVHQTMKQGSLGLDFEDLNNRDYALLDIEIPE